MRVTLSKPERIVFLDIDGVLNSERWLLNRPLRVKVGEDLIITAPREEEMVDPDAVKTLNILLDYTGAKVVVSSTWRMGRSLQELQSILGRHGLCPEKVIGMTPTLHVKRGAEVSAWLTQNCNGVKSFVILDDSVDLEPHLDRLVRTDWKTGLLPQHVMQALEIFKKQEVTA